MVRDNLNKSDKTYQQAEGCHEAKDDGCRWYDDQSEAADTWVR